MKLFDSMLRISALIVIVAGVLLHIYIGFFKTTLSQGGLLIISGFIVWSSLSYLICLVPVVGKRIPLIPLCGALLPFVSDLFKYYSVFINPSSYEDKALLVAMPFWNVVFLMPLGMVAGFLIAKFRKKKTASFDTNPF
jgi:hypothetical protein